MWLYTYYEYPQKWRVKETTAPGLALQSFASTGLSGLEGEEWVVVHGGGCWINIIWQANIGVQGNKYTNMGIEMDRTSKKDWSSQRSKIVDYSPEGFGFALCNQACDDHSRSWLEGQGYTEMEQFAEKSVLRIRRLELEGLCSRLLHEDCCMKHERGSRGRELLNFDRLLCFFSQLFAVSFCRSSSSRPKIAWNLYTAIKIKWGMSTKSHIQESNHPFLCCQIDCGPSIYEANLCNKGSRFYCVLCCEWHPLVLVAMLPHSLIAFGAASPTW